jgi:cell division protein FtsL
MGKVVKSVTFLVVTVLLITLLATTLYYNNLVSDKVSKISSLESQINNLNNEISSLKEKITGSKSQENLTAPSLLTELGVTEIAGSEGLNNRLWIQGTVTNLGEGTAFNAGLHVVASSANGTIVLNMTVPLNNNSAVSYGSQAASLSAYVSNGDNNPSYFLPSLAGGGIAVVGINVFHVGIASNWTVTAVWTDIP